MDQPTRDKREGATRRPRTKDERTKDQPAKSRRKFVYFVRHGETISNVNGIVQGLDDELSDRGKRQAAVIAERAQNIEFDRLITSDAVRAYETAKAISETTGKDIQTSVLFREARRPSSLIGRSHTDDEYKACLAEERKNSKDLSWRYEDEENFSDIHLRVEQAVTLLEEASEQSILVVTHGRFLRSLVSYLLTQKQLTPETWSQISHSLLATNTGVTICRFDDPDWHVLTWNDHAHFAE